RIVEDEGNRNLISWSPCGDFLRIYDCDEFARVVLPRYFRHCNWTSFVRQLNSNACGSSNSIKSADKSVLTWEFKHESFRRDAPKNQLSQIKRK
ncbi:HSF-type DNA-binding-domain-containing protein, partial [Zychaea mexicana]|uniref:HSF-type DNA-binding-domain-containing protein n=1 Tax=Zychaea mexicana TaxID=64656 RepID=UPI0022FEFA3F